MADRAMARDFVDTTLVRTSQLTSTSPEDAIIIRGLSRKIAAVKEEHQFFVQWCDRADALYFPTQFTDGGSDIWANDRTAKIKGRSHISANSSPVYVDIPAALQAEPPIENMLATDNTPEARNAASNLERLYTSWKQQFSFDLKFHKATTTKALYGRTAGRIIINADGFPEPSVIEQPRNLWFGWKTSDYEALDWAAYVLKYEPNALAEEFGVDVITYANDDGSQMPLVINTQQFQDLGVGAQNPRPWMEFGKSRIEVWDYWYRMIENGKAVTYNVVIAGNAVIQGPDPYPEYGGRLPYVPLFNTFIPGVPMGRPELWDIEPIIREENELLTAGGQMIKNGVAGDYWQLVGADAPTRVPPGLKPKRNELVGPGPGNRIETITPFIAQFQLEQFFGRIDRTKAALSGLNDLLLGLAPAQVLSSSKAINALISNYVTRLSMRRKLLYEWRREMWTLALAIWQEKDAKVKAIIDAGAGFLEIVDPSLNPRDEMETATRAVNLMNGKVWSQRRTMDATGVDDPETEQDLIREERTDATMFPESVQVMAQLMGALKSLGLTPSAATTAAVGSQATSGQHDLAAAGVSATPDNSTSSQLPGDQAIPPGDASTGAPPDPNAPQGMTPGPGAQPPPFAVGPPAVMQDKLVGGQTTGRILSQQKLGRR